MGMVQLGTLLILTREGLAEGLKLLKFHSYRQHCGSVVGVGYIILFHPTTN